MKYRVLTHEPGYRDSTEIVAEDLNLVEAMQQLFSLRRAYLVDRENNPSYGEVEAIGEFNENDNPTIYNAHFDSKQDYFRACEMAHKNLAALLAALKV